MHESVRLAQQVARLRDTVSDRIAFGAIGGHGVSLWPVNEIVLRSLIHAGNNDNEIARRYGADRESVTDLRTRYRL